MSDRSIEYAVQKLAGTFKWDKLFLSVGTIKSVDEDKATCVVVVENDVEVPGVLLQANICDGLLMIPKIDSGVSILWSTNNPAFVVQFSDIEKYYLQVGDAELTITSDGKIQLNDGSFYGLVKVEELVDKLNALENDLNTLKAAFSGWTPVPNDGGAALKAASATWAGDTFTDTVKADLENSDITHGKKTA